MTMTNQQDKSVTARDRRFWLPATEGGILRIGGLILGMVGLILLGIFFYDNLFTTAIFVISSLIIIYWLCTKPTTYEFKLTNDSLVIDKRVLPLSSIDSWTLIDLQEQALLLFKVIGKSVQIEVYCNKEDLTQSGMINDLTQKVAFNPGLETVNTLRVVMRRIGLI